MKVAKKTVLMLILSVFIISVCFLNNVEAFSYNASISLNSEAIKNKNFIIGITVKGEKRNI